MRGKEHPAEGDLRKTKAQLIEESETLRHRLRDGESISPVEFQNFSSAQFLGIMKVTDDAIISIDQEFRIVIYNQGAKKIFGWTFEEVINQPIEVLLPVDARGNHRQLIEEFSQGSSGSRIMGERSEVLGLRKNGDTFPAEASISKVEVEGRKYYTAILRDITDRKLMENRLRESQKMEAVGQLAGGIAHEFNNMLQIIINSAYFARNNLHESATTEKFLDNILRSANRSAELTKQLLTYSSKSALRLGTVGLNELIAGVMKLVKPVIGENVELEIRPHDELFLVEADRGLLEQAIINLCLNARDAMPDGGHLILETRNHHADQEFCNSHNLGQPGDYAMISVSDNGVGMSSEIRERIFEPFFTTKEKSRGTGLGLALVYGIVQQHNGVVEALSEPEIGSTLNIYLPRIDKQETRNEVPVASENSGGSETILVAEDEIEVLMMMSQSLEGKGYRVLTAKNGEEAMAVFKANADRIDLVILDMVMPKLRGREVYEQIYETGSDVPVLFSTGYSLDSSDAEFVAGKRLQTLQKPYAPNVLYTAVREVLDER